MRLEFNENEGRGKTVDYKFETKLRFLQNEDLSLTPKPVKTPKNNGDIISHRDRHLYEPDKIIKERQTLTFSYPKVEIKLVDLRMPQYGVANAPL